MIKFKAVPLSDSESESDDDRDLKQSKLKKPKLADPVQTSRRFTGGILISSESEIKDQSTSASMSAAEKKGLKEVEELERELDLKNTFSKETNRRDEDAEMNKYIDEQIRLRREAAKKERMKLDRKATESQEDSEFLELFNLPTTATDKIEDILLHSLSRNLASTTDERSEAMLSSQMLNGIPEVDLGIDERIRTIEATEEAKLRMASSSSDKRRPASSTVPVNFSSNFKQLRNNRDTHEGELKTSNIGRQSNPNHNSRENKVVTEAVVVVGEKPSEIEYKVSTAGERPPPRGKASDDYYLSKFKKNSRK